MEKERWLSKRVVGIHIEPYLAEYVSNKFKNDPKTGAVKIPYATDLYFVVWNLMAKPKRLLWPQASMMLPSISEFIYQTVAMGARNYLARTLPTTTISPHPQLSKSRRRRA